MINQIVRDCDIDLVWNILDALKMIIKWSCNKNEADSLKNNANKIIALI